MGNVEAIVNKTSIEYERVKKERKLDRDWMNIEDILSFQTSNLGLGRDGSIDLGHLGILYYMDDNKDGRFTLKEMHLFIARCCAREERWDKSFTEMQTQCQAWCTLLMWNSVIETGEHSVKKSGGGNSVQPERVGVKRFKVWMVKVLSRVRPYKTFNSKGPFKTKFLHMDSVKTLYELFNIRQSYGMGYQDFLDLMQRAAEEKVKIHFKVVLDYQKKTIKKQTIFNTFLKTFKF